MKTVADVMKEIDDVRSAINKMDGVVEGDMVNAIMSMAISDLIEYAGRYIACMLSLNVK